ncbi:MAG: outer membrane beta-barrel protein [Bryobacteraceae bacterium]|nr:outer membrane beta-barrel protein [Bryobacteraceae bacterium]
MIRILALALASAAAIFAQSAEFSFHGGVSRLNNSSIGSDGAGGSNYSLAEGFRFGFRTTVNNWRYAGNEFGYAYNRSKLELGGVSQGGMAIHQGFYNFLVYPTPDGATVRPFAAGGIHFNNYTPPGTSVTSGGGSTKFGFNYGGGVKVRLGEKYQVRFDTRYYQNGKPFSFLQGRSGLIGQLEVSVGFGLVI